MTLRVKDYVLKFDAAHRVLLALPAKILTENAMQECYDAIARFAAGVEGCTGIFDMSGVERILLSTKFLRALAASPPAIPAGTIRVVVAPDRLAFGLSRMFQQFRDGMEGQFHVVRTIDEAFAILQLDTAELVPVEA